eukprot:TRINITY_DN12270_c0_g3_i2.p1 TRINITY_DN12270_c0_g3~~TRINITY_DN12270_c0_g3_i2.p1  ORF type:complete len:157 (+),score=41.53 TRINITY_DN12270_c0_g3_i2:53-523(+)
MDTAAKVKEYESFLNDKLKTDLKQLVESRDKLLEDASEYHRLGQVINSLQDAKNHGNLEGALKTQVDLGNSFFCQANVSDPEHIFVDIGMSFYVELSWPEALKVIDSRTDVLEQQAKDLEDKIAEVKALIRMVLEGLRELQGLSAESDAPETRPSF